MRKTILVAAVAAFAGFCFASASSYASLRYNIWKTSDASFKLGYVIGYLDAVGLSRKRDFRTAVPNVPGKNFERWVEGVNAFYADPANEKKEVPDAMYAVGTQIRTDMMRTWNRDRRQRPVPSATAGQ